jgi:predicted phage baseplate assembly protein
VRLFGPFPTDLGPDNVAIEGGIQVTGIRAVAVTPAPEDDPELAGCVLVAVDRVGDLSPYRLCFVKAGPHGGPGTRPFPGFDRRYACAAFTFRQDCPGLVDCAPAALPTPHAPAPPVIDYLARDYASLRRALLERLALTVPGFRERHAPDLGITLVELLAYAGDALAYRQDAVATEAYLDTARLRPSVRRHARLVDYRMHDGCAARAVVCLEVSGTEVELPSGTYRFLAGPEVFEPVVDGDVVLREAHNAIGLWTWGDAECTLRAGATSATLRDSDPTAEDPYARVLALEPGDLLVFEELIGVVTGLPADADRTHRQVVRLTAVRRGRDPLYDQPLLEVTWDRADALTFPLCVRARGGPECAEQEVGVARGNAVLVEHGSAVTFCGGDPFSAHWPAAPPTRPGCPPSPAFGCPDDGPGAVPAYPPRRVDPTIVVPRAPVTQHAPFPDPRTVATAQAAYLRGVPDRARTRLSALLDAARAGDPPAPDDPYLRLLFGPATLATVPLAAHPVRALRTLLARFDELMARKLRRIADLVARARSGYVLTAAEDGWEVGQSWGAAEGSGLDPAHPALHGPVAPALTPDPRAALPAVVVTADADPAPWLPRRDLLDSGPTDRDLVGELLDDGRLRLRFGDGRTGTPPPAGATLGIRCRIGSGPAGNVGAEAIDQLVLCHVEGLAVTRVRNPTAATGGTAPEPLDDVRRLAPGEARRHLRRAVTAADYAALAGGRPGVQRAAADLVWTGSWYEARVALDPLGAEVAPAWLLDDVRAALHAVRRIGHDITVRSAQLVPLHLIICVQASPDAIAGHVRAGVAAALGDGVTADGRRGLFHPDALTFGTPVRVSRIVAAAAAVPGVLSVTVRELTRLFGGPSDALTTGVLPMAPDEVAQLDDDPTRPERGVLEIDLRGGR